MIVPLAPGGAKRSRAFLKMLDGNLSGGADKVGTLHDMRFVFLDNWPWIDHIDLPHPCALHLPSRSSLLPFQRLRASLSDLP